MRRSSPPREEILGGLGAMLPAALAQTKNDAPAATAAGFERAIEGVVHLARDAVRIEPRPPGEPSDPAPS